MGNHQKKELLEELREAAHCDCISDLRGPERSVEHLVKRAEERVENGGLCPEGMDGCGTVYYRLLLELHDKEEAAGYLKSFFS